MSQKRNPLRVFDHPDETNLQGIFHANPSKKGDNMSKPLLTIKEVADYLRIDKFTVYRLVAQGEIPAYKVGSQWRFDHTLVERWLRQNLNVSTQEVAPHRPKAK